MDDQTTVKIYTTLTGKNRPKLFWFQQPNRTPKFLPRCRKSCTGLVRL